MGITWLEDERMAGRVKDGGRTRDWQAIIITLNFALAVTPGDCFFHRDFSTVNRQRDIFVQFRGGRRNQRCLYCGTPRLDDAVF